MKKAFLLIIILSLVQLSCSEEDDDLIILEQDQEFSIDLHISGDEEGARIIHQASHYSRSELVRDSSTNYSVWYFYTPEAGYSGPDEVVIETCTGGVGLSCDQINEVKFEFSILE